MKHTICNAWINRAQSRRTVAAGVLVSLACLAACGGGEPEVRTPPYVLKKGCEFSLELGGGNSTATTIEKGNTMVTLTLSMGGYQVGVSDCQVVDNPDELPVYEE